MENLIDWSDPSNRPWKRAIVRYLDRIGANARQPYMIKQNYDTEDDTSDEEYPDFFENNGTFTELGSGAFSSVYELTINHLSEERSVCVKYIDDSFLEVEINQIIASKPYAFPHLLEAILVKEIPRRFQIKRKREDDEDGKGRQKTAKRYFLVMEVAYSTILDYINGDWYHLIDDPISKWQLIGDLLSSIIELAYMGYEHRDMHSGNFFLVDRRGINRLVLALGDFGVCRKIDPLVPFKIDIILIADLIERLFGVKMMRVFMKFLSEDFGMDFSIEEIEGDILDVNLPRMDFNTFVRMRDALLAYSI